MKAYVDFRTTVSTFPRGEASYLAKLPYKGITVWSGAFHAQFMLTMLFACRSRAVAFRLDAIHHAWHELLKNLGS